MEELVQTRIEGRVAHVVFNRPEKLNAFSDSMLVELEEAAARIEETQEICAVIISANGRAFCVGADLSGSAPDGLPGPSREALETSDRIFRRWDRLSVPVIAAVDGAALAGGLEFLLCCDIIVASAKASFGDVHAKWALLPGAGGNYRLPRRVGRGAASRLLFTGETVSAEEAFRIGLVDLLSNDSAFEAASSLAEQIATRSPLGLREMKRLARQAFHLDEDEALLAAREALFSHRSSHDFSEGLTAFAERRAPNYTGS